MTESRENPILGQKHLLDKERVRVWDVDDVATYLLLKEIDEEVVLAFLTKEIDGPKLLSLAKESLVREFGVKSRTVQENLMGLIQDLRTHSLAPPSSQTSAIIAHDPSKHQADHGGPCHAHKLLLKYYCVCCDLFICSKCALENHEGHPQGPIKERAGDLRQELLDYVDILRLQSSHIEEVLRECGAALERLAETTEVATRDILSMKIRLIQEITDISEMALAQVKEHEATKKSYLHRKISENLALKKEIDALNADLSHTLQTCGPSVVMQQREGFKNLYSELLGSTRAGSIAQLDSVFNVHVDIRNTLNDVIFLIRNSLISVSANSGFHLTQGVSVLVNASLSPLIERLLVLGGNGFSLVDMYDMVSRGWSKCPGLSQVRGFSPAVGYTSNTLYIAGGWDGTHYLKTAEKLDLKAMRWTPISSMALKRAYTTGVCISNGSDGEKFLITGGWDGASDYYSSCEVYQVNVDRWFPAANLISPRAAHCSLVYNNSVVVIGGSSGKNPLNTCETLRQNDQWTPFPSFIQARSAFGATVHDGKIYIAGGYAGVELDSMEIFDGAAWQVLSTTLSQPRYACGLVSIAHKIIVLGGTKGHMDEYDPQTQSVSCESFPPFGDTPVRFYLAAISF